MKLNFVCQLNGILFIFIGENAHVFAENHMHIFYFVYNFVWMKNNVLQWKISYKEKVRSKVNKWQSIYVVY